MKSNRILIGASVLLVIALFVWWYKSRNIGEPATKTVENSAASNEITAEVKPPSNPQPKTEKRTSQPAPISRIAGEENTSVSPEVQAYVQNILADPQYDWKQPINFYGKVVDENDQPVADASIHFKWTDLSDKGTAEADTTSDGSGLFSLTDRKGKRMTVTVSKNGYYTPKSEALSSFEYANPADGLFTPDPSNPVIYHLRKKGEGAALVKSQSGGKDYLGITMPLDGTPVQVPLDGANTGLKASQQKPAVKDWKQATEWSFRMELPSGGFVEQSDEFPFEAPQNGYQSVVEFKFQKGQTNWNTSLKKDFYIKVGTPARYGKLHLETSILMSGARFGYAINPNGSRNLEPK